MDSKSNIRTLSSLIVKSINNKSLDKDYGTFLEMCRSEHISSYTLNLMIDSAVSSFQHDSQIKSINTLPYFGWQVKELNEILREEKNKKEKRVWPYWLTIIILFLLLSVSLYIIDNLIIDNPQLRFQLNKFFSL